MTQTNTNHVPSREQEIHELIRSAGELSVVERALESLLDDRPDDPVLSGAVRSLERIHDDILEHTNRLAWPTAGAVESRTEHEERATYAVVNERYGLWRQTVTLDELRTVLRDVFGDTETELVEREDGIYEVASGELVAEAVATSSKTRTT